MAAAPETEQVVWRGAEALRPFLVPITDLEPFPGNPRRGDVESVRQSLRRWGQTRAVLTDANADAAGLRVVAGHHVAQAAAEEGWTHVAVIPNEFQSEEDARAYLLADNRTHDLGAYDFDLLYQQIKAAQAADSLFGTGYTDEYVAMLDKEMAETITDVMAPPEFPEIDPDTMVTQHRCPSCGYEWSGNHAPGANGSEPSPPNE